MFRVPNLIAAITLIFAITQPAFGQTSQPTPREPQLIGAVAKGKILYDRACVECHGPSGVGTDKGPPFLHRVYHPGHHGDVSFFKAVLHGATAHHWQFGDMKPVDGLDRREIGQIINYVRALQKANGLF